MFVKVLAVFGFVAVAYAADLSVGIEGGKLIFEQNITASPAIWRQVKLLTVNATNTTDELISRVVVLDNRTEKDGEATVTEGGEGQRNVTLELKSPAVFRGFDFTVQVFATDPNVYGRVPNHPVQTGTQETQNPQVPALFPNHPEPTGADTQNPQVIKDLDVNSNQTPKDGGDIIIGAPVPTASSTTEEYKDDQQKISPAVVGDEQTRLNRDIQDQKTKDQTSVPTPVDVDATKDTKVNENANKTVVPEMDENLKKALDTIFDSKTTQKPEEEDAQKVVPVMPQAESDGLVNLRDDEENRKVRQATKEPILPAFPKELTHDEHTTTKIDLSSSTQNIGQEPSVLKVVVPVTDEVLTNDDHTTPKIEASSTTEKNVGQEKAVPSVVSVTSEGSSTTPANKVTEFKLPENVQTTQELERNIKGHHFGHHHAVPLPYVN